MHNDIEQSEKAYWTREVGDILDVQVGTVRKYARLMEEFGYHFHRNEQGYRAFLDTDIIAMQQIQQMTNNRDMTLKTAVKAVMTRHPQGRNTDVGGAVIDKNTLNEIHHNGVIEKMDLILKDNQELKNIVKELAERLDKQQEYINNSIEKRDRELTKAINEIQEQKQIAASGNKEKKGVLARLFGK